MNFDPNDLTAIQKIELIRSKKAGFPITLDGELNVWRNLIIQSEHGYDDIVDEFTNDLSARWTLEYMFDALSSEGRKELLKVLGPLDDRFRKCTVELSQPIIAYDGISPGKHFWFFRAPKRIGKKYFSGFEGYSKPSLKERVEIF